MFVVLITNKWQVDVNEQNKQNFKFLPTFREFYFDSPLQGLKLYSCKLILVYPFMILGVGERSEQGVPPPPYIDGWAEQRLVSPGGWRTSYLTGRLKTSRYADEERRISALLRPLRGQYMARYDVLRPHGEMGRPWTARWDRTDFLRPRGGMSCSSTARWDRTLFRSAVDI